VEGYGEVNAVRDLITRIASEVCGTWTLVAPAFRLDSGKMRKPDELAKAVQVVAERVPDRGGVLILRDGDDGDVTCPVDLARSLSPKPGLVTVPVEVVIARHEYEAWFLAAAESLRTHQAVLDDATSPDDPEAIRGAKQRLEKMMNQKYRETLHQVSFSAIMDLTSAQARSRSFRRMVNAVRSLVADPQAG